MFLYHHVVNIYAANITWGTWGFKDLLPSILQFAGSPRVQSTEQEQRMGMWAALWVAMPLHRQMQLFLLV